jgi:peptide/nickel transport system substrate-binding protein
MDFFEGKSAVRRLALAATMLLAALGLLTLPAWAGSPSASPSPSAQQVVLRVGRTVNPDNLNPFIGYETTSFTIWDLNYDGLVSYDKVDLHPTGDLAESWNVTPDGKTWTFHIRHNVRWQDGLPLTAKDVAFTYTYIIKGQLANFASQAAHITSVVATDDYTVVIHCDQPKATMLTDWVPILPEHIWSKVSYKAATKSYPNAPPIVGTGPFQTVEWKRNSYVKMVANKDYWAGAPHYDAILFSIYTNKETLAEDLKAGTIDATADMSPAVFKTFENKPDFGTNTSSYPMFRSVGFNCYAGPSLGNPVLKDPKFRVALSYAVDRAKVTAVAWQGFGTPGSTLELPNYYKNPDYHWQPTPDLAQSFDLQKAGQMLDAAGYPLKNGVRVDHNGKPIELRLWALNDEPAYTPAAKLIASWWKQIGLKIVFAVHDPDSVSAAVYNTNAAGKLCPDYDVFVWGWDGTFDPYFVLSVYLTSQINSWSDSGWSNPQYDKLYEQQASTLDTTKRAQIILDMQKLFYQEAPNLILVYPFGLEAYNTTRWQGWTKIPAASGSVLDRWGFLAVQPKVANGSTSNTGLISAIVAGAVVLVAVVVGVLVFRRRRSARQVELA